MQCKGDTINKDVRDSMPMQRHKTNRKHTYPGAEGCAVEHKIICRIAVSISSLFPVRKDPRVVDRDNLQYKNIDSQKEPAKVANKRI